MSDGKELEKDMANAGSFKDLLDEIREPISFTQRDILDILSKSNTPMSIDDIRKSSQEYLKDRFSTESFQVIEDAITLEYINLEILELVQSNKISIVGKENLYCIAASE